jgi:hypothetical protein
MGVVTVPATPVALQVLPAKSPGRETLTVAGETLSLMDL